MYKLVGNRATRAFRPLWMLEELGVPYEHVAAAPRSDEVRAFSPLGKVPVLVDGDAVIPDSMAILTYLADKHAAFTYPAGTLERARQDAWTFRLLDEVDALLWTAARHSFILPEDQRVPEVKDSLKAEFGRNLHRIAGEMASECLLGDDPTVPDFLLAHCLGWARNAKFPDAPEVLVDYLRRLRERPAFQRAAAL
ncbi:glutathione S-transferase family protein [Marivita hallyeonensis]|uniref:Glutathione S-transferase n=1 Tax=Marivita hallyeonensis TaxID=996342 RepID=A0A1M5M4I5_9RHOB|nr:glutathione S-transferase [Marivita hallyeonensis]SHG72232.1 glutathione S-transferase [Marivita hallyeonensis]